MLKSIWSLGIFVGIRKQEVTKMQSKTVEKIKRIKRHKRGFIREQEESNTVRQDKAFRKNRRLRRLIKENFNEELV